LVIFSLRSPRDGHLVAALAPNEGPTDRGLVGQLGVGGLGLGGADDRVLVGLAGLVLDVDDRADADDIGAEVRRVDHGGRTQLVLQRGDPRLQHRLGVLGVVVLGVLRNVAELAGLFNPRSDFTTAGGGELVELRLEVDKAFLREDDVFGHSDQTCVCNRQTRKTRRVRRVSRAGEPAVGA
jgi:hypothetical protein